MYLISYNVMFYFVLKNCGLSVMVDACLRVLGRTEVLSRLKTPKKCSHILIQLTLLVFVTCHFLEFCWSVGMVRPVIQPPLGLSLEFQPYGWAKMSRLLTRQKHYTTVHILSTSSLILHTCYTYERLLDKKSSCYVNNECLVVST